MPTKLTQAQRDVLTAQELIDVAAMEHDISIMAGTILGYLTSIADARLQRYAGPRDVQEQLRVIAKEIHTQDNAITHEPIFMVQRHRRTYGFDPAYSDKHVYVDEEYNEVTDFSDYLCPECSKPLAVEDMDDEACTTCNADLDLGNWCLTKTAYQDTWENVQPFFTRKGAEEYLRINGHNLDGKEKPRIYVESAYRNAEWIAIRKMLARLNLSEELVDEVIAEEKAAAEYTGGLHDADPNCMHEI